MCKVEIIEEEIIVVKQALSLYKDKLQENNRIIDRSEVETVNKILDKIKEELKK